MIGWRAASPWIRWVAPFLIAAAAWRSLQAERHAPLACSSGSHAWWVRSEGREYLLEHVADTGDGVPSGVHRAAAFTDEPVAIAAFDDRVWVAFRAEGGRCEVVSGRAVRNPASGLWFSVPPSLRRCPSLPGDGVPCLAAVGDRLFAIAQGGLLELVGERWVSREPPAGVSLKDCQLAGSRDALWLLESTSRGPSRRWMLGEGMQWESRPLDIDRTAAAVPGAARLAFQSASPAQVGLVEAGAWSPVADAPSGAAVIGWGDGLAAVSVQGKQPLWCRWDAATDGFGAFQPLQPQASVADRWFHLPVLGVLTLGALLLALVVRVVRRSFERPDAVTRAAAMPLGARAAALAMDAFPSAVAAWMAFDAEWAQVLTPPLWSLNLGESMPFVWMTAGTVVFGALEESVGGRSLGKRIFGGQVVARSGARASFLRHLARNLLKGLSMLSPVVALPAFIDRRGEGVAETISATRVVAVGSPADTS